MGAMGIIKNIKGIKTMATKKHFAECPACGEIFECHNNMEVDCPNCDRNFVYCDEDDLSIWD